MKKKIKWKKLIIILVIVAAAIIAAVLIVGKKLKNSAETSNMVQLEEVTRQDLSDFISLTGSVSGETKINYSSAAESKILSLNVQVGDEVKKGDVLVTLDKESIESQISMIEKSISNSQALSKNQSKLNRAALSSAKNDQKNQLDQAQKQIDDAKADYEAVKKTYNEMLSQLSELNTQKNNASSSDEKEYLSSQISDMQAQVNDMKLQVSAAKKAVEDAQYNYKTVESSTSEAVASAQNTVDMESYSDETDTSSRTQLEDLKRQLEECTIVCQEDGIVTAVNTSVGNVNTPGSAIVTVENDQSMTMTASVDETDILKLQEGMKATVTADALGDKEISGEVSKVVKVYNGSVSVSDDMGGEMSGGNSTGGFSVQIRLEKSDLISGMTAKAKISLTDKSNVLCVPYDLVMEDEDGQKYVLCAEDNGDGSYTAVRKDINVGEEINYYTEVLGGDVEEGDYVILDFSIAEGDIFQAEISSFDDTYMEE